MHFIEKIAQNHLKKHAIYASYRKYIIFSKKTDHFIEIWLNLGPKTTQNHLKKPLLYAQYKRPKIYWFSPKYGSDYTLRNLISTARNVTFFVKNQKPLNFDMFGFCKNLTKKVPKIH